MSMSSSTSDGTAAGGSIGSGNGVGWTSIIIAVAVLIGVWMFFKYRKG